MAADLRAQHQPDFRFYVASNAPAAAAQLGQSATSLKMPSRTVSHGRLKMTAASRCWYPAATGPHCRVEIATAAGLLAVGIPLRRGCASRVPVLVGHARTSCLGSRCQLARGLIVWGRVACMLRRENTVAIEPG